ncbi:3-oxoacyl-ACP synthase III family protein [Empedobacter sp. UBA7248]|uniref:3-oxoacyl-ACP synthase III family protein n=1 Tax=Empedobacter sp. UBA7248 TaxID=1946448 RepID=UPI0025C26E6E|nr:3-oxoacyl-[acyl-carrier-protein] synthase III C-terminal domain-containing protein [Empedobacter sp. UBA7248]
MGNHFTGVGNYIPTKTISNLFFDNHHFLDEKGATILQDNATIAYKLKQITGIEERRYAENSQVTSDLGYLAAASAIKNAKINVETIDYIIFAHNFGDVRYGTIQSDMVPSLAARVKHKLKIQNPYCVAYDVVFGCPGWIEGVIQANAFINAGLAKRCLVIGAETLSRVVDRHDRDSMIYADGAGAVIIESGEKNIGIQAHLSASYANVEKEFLYFGKSYNSDHCPDTKYIKMHGRKIYEFALSKVPLAMKKCIDDSLYNIDDINKIIIHQANEKMDEAIVKRFYRLYDKNTPKDIMPMVIHKLGNSSVATVPILLKMILNDELENHHINEGDVVLFASVGAGMNINTFIYQF